RTLLKNVLEVAGYQVFTAEDGVDGLASLLRHRVDLILSDVEMPRMNGFELTAKVRSHRTLAKIPVVLLTSPDSEDSLARGLEVGADAYVSKSVVVPGNLVEIVRNLGAGSGWEHVRRSHFPK